MNYPEIKCGYSEMMDLANVVSHPKNPNKHSRRQIELLSKLIKYQGWRHPVIVSQKSGFVVAGHGRVEAAKLLGLNEVPVEYQDFDNEAQEYQFMVSDNSIQELSELDEVMIQQDILDFGPDFDLDQLAMPDFEIKKLDEIPENTSVEFDASNFDKFEHQCPKCGFEWDDNGRDNS